MGLLIEKAKTMFVRLWNDFLVFLEYFVKAPFIEIHSLIETIHSLIKIIITYFKKSHSNGSVTIFYIMVVLTSIQSIRGIDRISMLFLFIITIITFVWAMASLPHWREYYKEKYFKK